MSTTHWPWTILQIAPTEDRKAIREAYSRLLKALDHEAETEAYMDLRHARDAALSGEFLHPHAPDIDEDDFGLGDPLPEGSEPASVDTAPALTEPEEKPVFTAAYDDDDDRRFRRMADLLLDDGELTPEEAGELDGHLDALFADERMADLGHYARVEGWLAELLADRYPRGAALFPKVAAYFHWADRTHELGVHPAIPWLFNAHEGESLLRELNTPGHAYHREWIELAKGKPQGMLWTRGIDKPRMGNLIATIRRDYPWLEQEHWQPELVARWEKKAAGGNVKGPGVWTWIGLSIFALSMLSQIVDDDRSGVDHNPAALAAVEAANADKHIASFIASFPNAAADGRSLETLRARSPKSFSTLQRSANMPESLTEEAGRAMMRDIADIYYLIIDNLPYEAQVADARFRAAEIGRLREQPQACADFIRNPRIFLRQSRNIDDISPDYRYRMFSVVHDEYDDREWPLVHKQATIPGDVIGKLIKRSGVPEQRVRDVLSGRSASEADICRTIGSFYELLTEIPAMEAGKILPAFL